MVRLTDKNYHEDYVEHGQLEVGPDRQFAWVFTGFFAVVGLYPVVFSSGEPRVWAIGVAAVFLVLGIVAPRILHPLNVLWMQFGRLLQMIVSPIVLGFLFFLTVTPMALLLRMMGRDILRLRLDKESSSYWIDRNPPGPPPDSMKNQF